MRVYIKGFELIFGNRSKYSLFQKLACGGRGFVPHTQFIDDLAQTGWSRISRATGFARWRPTGFEDIDSKNGFDCVIVCGFLCVCLGFKIIKSSVDV